jgi:MoaA/NifB/PqqE/SkfB family radical SAM enzyme
MPAALPYRPHYCVWELTLACNLRCTHCGSDAGQRRADELSTAECLSTVDQLADLECKLLSLSGGEPTLREDWSRIAATAVRSGITVNMVTNGTTLTDDTAGQVAEVGLANVGVSIDGPEPIHDDLRGPGTFRSVTRGIERLRARGVPVAALTHLNRKTLAALAQTHRLVSDLGVELWRLQLGKPMGRLSDRELLLRPRDLLAAIPEIVRLRQLGPLMVTVGDSLGYYGPYEELIRRHPAYGPPRAWAGCQAGMYAIGIESDGGIKGCLSLQARLHGGVRDPFREGSLRERPLAEVWYDPEAFAFNRRWQLDDLEGACRRCDHAQLCRGGARCVAAAFTGGLADNPYCYHRQLQARKGARTERPALRQHLIASALSMGLGLLGAAGCGGRPIPTDGGGDVAPASDRTRRDGRADLRRTDGNPCAGYTCHNTCPACEYGIEPPAALFSQCCCPNVCCDCDYGVLPPPGCCK